MPRPESVLVTRPAGQASALCDLLREAGYEPHHQPMIELEANPEPGPEQRGILLDLDRYQHVIFISGNAVRFGMDNIEDYWPQIPVGIEWYAVGAATARRLADYGVRASAPRGEMTSEGLLALPALAAVDGDRVLIVKGEGGRSTLREELERRGARVDELACYRRRCPTLVPGELAESLRHWDIGTVLLSSGEALQNMLGLLSPGETLNVMELCLVLPSQRVTDQAAAAGFGELITAENASDAAMLRALVERRPPVERMRER